jgi:DNA-binding XRE family transcriptional regulator
MLTLTTLKLSRLRAGLTCEALARAVGVSRTHLTLVENGRRKPSRTLAARLRAVLLKYTKRQK